MILYGLLRQGHHLLLLISIICFCSTPKCTYFLKHTSHKTLLNRIAAQRPPLSLPDVELDPLSPHHHTFQGFEQQHLRGFHPSAAGKVQEGFEILSTWPLPAASPCLGNNVGLENCCSGTVPEALCASPRRASASQPLSLCPRPMGPADEGPCCCWASSDGGLRRLVMSPLSGLPFLALKASPSPSCSRTPDPGMPSACQGFEAIWKSVASGILGSSSGLWLGR